MISSNHPSLWLKHLQWPDAHSQKYNRGYAVILGGDIQTTGAAKLAARAALRSGAGLVSVLCDPQTWGVYAGAFESIMAKHCPFIHDVTHHLTNPRVTAALLGSGAGVTDRTKALVRATLAAKKPVVLDADALTVFASNTAELWQQIAAPCILTPHEGEFQRVFASISGGSRAERCANAARMSNTVVVLKGAKTVIASPDGRVVVNRETSPYLATAGSGDVLAGITTGILAQGVPAFEAACAAVWIHSQAARHYGVGLIAEDLPPLIPTVLRALLPHESPQNG
jgi:NAD(P)H-hydrate epimerase